ncbi:hypothetical protein ACOSP7_002962 [Xanthoceras sorbifolium]|uniref:DUF7894 domain-containing protein n=1 Tax=Xanthoceras sorbifolium TaxID=99658 RepID=A0ABQ8IIP8_9ROSI|nr:hypothetical protein JRO89_XS01G0114500 [Xanthoceras sorbifolium]
MKVASKLIFLLRDPDGLVASIADALHSNPKSSLRRLEESFELSLQRYGITEEKACGQLVHFVDDDDEKGHYQVTVLLLQNYEPPTLVCAINEVLAQITGETSSTVPMLLVPFVVESSKLKGENKSLATTGSVSLYGVQIGPEMDLAQAMGAGTQKPPSSLQVHYEPLACFLHLARILNLPTFILIGQKSRSPTDKTLGGELETLYNIGELLASNTGLCFTRDKITWNPTKTSKDSQEPWRALYG